MSAISFLLIGNHPLLDCRDTYDPNLAALFTEDELVVSNDTYGYKSTAGALLDRLNLLGFNIIRVQRDLDMALAAVQPISHSEFDSSYDKSTVEKHEFVRRLDKYINSNDEYAIYEEPEWLRWKLDLRAIVRLALDCASLKSTPVFYNLWDLVDRGLLDRERRITDEARQDWRDRSARDAPLLVLTEGSTDAHLLADGLRVTHPHAVQYVRFMDFTNHAEGGVSGLVRLVRAFAAAGVSNRTIALFDNDAAAHDATRQLKTENLPESYCIMHYPPLPLLEQYPTVGPQSAEPTLLDINGTAGSLEMYLGVELLNKSGSLTPVQWNGYISALRAYQGSLPQSEKRRIRDAFRKKASQALRDAGCMINQDWSGIAAINNAIVNAL